MKYQLMPPLSAEDFASLEASIIQHGVLVPVEYDEDGEIIDGHHRVAVCESLGLVDWPRFVRRGLSEIEKRKLSRELNISRRHLSTAQKQDIIADQLRDTPSISSRAIAAMLGVHHSTVETVRKRMVDGGEIRHHDEVEGRDGTKQPARKTIKTAFVPDGPNVGEYMKGAKAIRGQQQKLKHSVRLAHMDMVAETGKATAPAQLDRAYPVYYADPPWKFGVRSEVTGREKSAENHYPTLPTDEIAALMEGLIGGSNPAVLFLWATNPMLPDALFVMDMCGFSYVHHWIWDKEVAGTGYWGRDRHELLLIGRRGDVAAPLPGTQPETIHRERKGAHSKKPAFFAETIERLYPGIAKLELFCRAPRPGWSVWGFESGVSPCEASGAPVALSKDEEAGGLPEAAGPPATDGEGPEAPVELPAASDAGGEATVRQRRNGSSSEASIGDERREAAGPPATDGEGSVSAFATALGEFAERRFLHAVSSGLDVPRGSLFDRLVAEGLVWPSNKPQLTVGGAERLKHLEEAEKAAAASDTPPATDGEGKPRGRKKAVPA